MLLLADEPIQVQLTDQSGGWFTQAWATLFASLFVVAAAGIAYAGVRHTVRSQKSQFAQSHEVGIERDLRSRYVTCAEQLGSDSVAVRLAAVYALAALADDWHNRGNNDDRRVCINVLKAYLRVRRPPAAPRRRPFMPPPESDADPLDLGESEVRQTIISIIAQRSHYRPEEPRWWPPEDCQLSDADLSHLTIAANLSGMDLSRAVLMETDLRSATLVGVNLSGAFLFRTDLQNMDLSGVNLRDADLWRADLSGTDLQNAADLTGAKFEHAHAEKNTLWPKGFPKNRKPSI